jgi:hypothetical protein
VSLIDLTLRLGQAAVATCHTLASFTVQECIATLIVQVSSTMTHLSRTPCARRCSCGGRVEAFVYCTGNASM